MKTIGILSILFAAVSAFATPNLKPYLPCSKFMIGTQEVGKGGFDRFTPSIKQDDSGNLYEVDILSDGSESTWINPLSSSTTSWGMFTATVQQDNKGQKSVTIQAGVAIAQCPPNQ